MVWAGGSTLTDFFVVPAAFSHLPRNEAIDFGAFVFRRWNFAECLLGAIGVLSAFAMAPAGWGTARRSRRRRWSSAR